MKLRTHKGYQLTTRQEEAAVNIRYTTQTAYEKIRAYFSKDGATLAYDEDMQSCMYRTAEGRKCAVGCLVPDSLYTPDMEHNPANKAIERAGLDQLFEKVDMDFLLQAQSAHDNTDDVGDFISSLDAVAEMHGLRMAP